MLVTGKKLIKMFAEGQFQPPPIAEFLDFSLSALNPGKAVIEFEASKKHWNPMDTLHGGVLCDIADAAMGMAYATLIDENQTLTTVELKINFLRPVIQGRLTARAEVVRSGRRLGLVQCDVFNRRGQHVARATSTCMTLAPDHRDSGNAGEADRVNPQSKSESWAS